MNLKARILVNSSVNRSRNKKSLKAISYKENLKRSHFVKSS